MSTRTGLFAAVAMSAFFAGCASVPDQAAGSPDTASIACEAAGPSVGSRIKRKDACAPAGGSQAEAEALLRGGPPSVSRPTGTMR